MQATPISADLLKAQTTEQVQRVTKALTAVEASIQDIEEELSGIAADLIAKVGKASAQKKKQRDLQGQLLDKQV